MIAQKTWFKTSIMIGFGLFVLAQPIFIHSASQGSSSGSGLPGTSSAHSSDKKPAPIKKPEAVPVIPTTHLTKPVYPSMSKPFGMPGVVGLEKGKWVGTDYLGHLSNNIGIDVEVVKDAYASNAPDAASLTTRVANIFKKNDMIPDANVSEGPPLPFLHVLVIIYSIDKDKFVIFGTCRLFEHIDVIRKGFEPAGDWQGITWESQEIVYTTAAELDEKIKNLVDKLATSFASRYTSYHSNIDSQ